MSAIRPIPSDMPAYGTVLDVISKAVVTRKPHRAYFSIFTLHGLGFDSVHIRRSLRIGEEKGWILKLGPSFISRVALHPTFRRRVRNRMQMDGEDLQSTIQFVKLRRGRRRLSKVSSGKTKDVIMAKDLAVARQKQVEALRKKANQDRIDRLRGRHSEEDLTRKQLDELLQDEEDENQQEEKHKGLDGGKEQLEQHEQSVDPPFLPPSHLSSAQRGQDTTIISDEDDQIDFVRQPVLVTFLEEGDQVEMDTQHCDNPQANDQQAELKEVEHDERAELVAQDESALVASSQMEIQAEDGVKEPQQVASQSPIHSSRQSPVVYSPCVDCFSRANTPEFSDCRSLPPTPDLQPVATPPFRANSSVRHNSTASNHCASIPSTPSPLCYDNASVLDSSGSICASLSDTSAPPTTPSILVASSEPNSPITRNIAKKLFRKKHTITRQMEQRLQKSSSLLFSSNHRFAILSI